VERQEQFDEEEENLKKIKKIAKNGFDDWSPQNSTSEENRYMKIWLGWYQLHLKDVEIEDDAFNTLRLLFTLWLRQSRSKPSLIVKEKPEYQVQDKNRSQTIDETVWAMTVKMIPKGPGGKTSWRWWAEWKECLGVGNALKYLFKV
jgi:hypothetical protein